MDEATKKQMIDDGDLCRHGKFAGECFEHYSEYCENPDPCHELYHTCGGGNAQNPDPDEEEKDNIAELPTCIHGNHEGFCEVRGCLFYDLNCDFD